MAKGLTHLTRENHEDSFLDISGLLFLIGLRLSAVAWLQYVLKFNTLFYKDYEASLGELDPLSLINLTEKRNISMIITPTILTYTGEIWYIGER